MRNSDLTKLRHSKEVFTKRCENAGMSLCSSFINMNTTCIVKCNKCNSTYKIKPDNYKNRELKCLNCIEEEKYEK